MTIRFDSRVAIITGAGGGLGRSHAMLLASRGAKVVVNDPGGAVDGRGGDNAAADRVVAEIQAAGGQAIANYDSVATFKGAQSIIAAAMGAFGSVDILVNNAGILRDRSFSKMDMEDFEAVMQVHLMGTVYCTKAAWPVMNERRYGRIVVTTSGAGLNGNFGQANYAAAKMAMIGFQNSLKQEGAKNNIRINAISPVANTRMTGPVSDPLMLKFSAPEFISPAVAWLCSEACDVSGKIVGAGAGFFCGIEYSRTPGVLFEPTKPISIDDLAKAATEILDFSKAVPYKGIGGRIRELLVERGIVSG